MKLTFAFSLLLLLCLASCGKKGGSSNSKRTTKISEQQIQAVMENQIFECASIDGRSCPAGIARLLILNKNDADKSAVCSGFMMNEDTLVTNHHCVSSLSVCHDTYVAIYNGFGYEQNKCKSIVKLLNDYSNPNDPRKKLDVAIVKLERPYFGNTFKAASERPRQFEVVTAWVIDHTGLDNEEGNLFESRVTEFKCRVSLGRERESLMLEECPVIDGNSGSPIFNSQGEVLGIIWGGTKTHISSSLDLDDRRNLLLNAAATEISFFSDFINF